MTSNQRITRITVAALIFIFVGYYLFNRFNRESQEPDTQSSSPAITVKKDFAPSEASWLAPKDPLQSTERLATTKDCAECHQDVAAQWRDSAHAHASFDNPWYLASVDAFRKQVGHEKSRFCAGCHDPVLLFSQKIDQEVLASDPDAHAGITCLSCHGVDHSTAKGNASYRLGSLNIDTPDPADPESIALHKEQVASKSLRNADLCGTCHRSFFGPHIDQRHVFLGIDDIGTWRRSAYAGVHSFRYGPEIEAQTCQGCHMQKVEAQLGDMAAKEGRIASHRFAGAHLPLASQTRSPAQRIATEKSLRHAAALYAFADIDQRWLRIDLVIENKQVGHRLPGGTRDLADTWLELLVYDRKGQLLGTSGNAHREDKDDTNAFVLRSTLVDKNGIPERLHRVERFAAPLFDHTIPPQDAKVVRYFLKLPRRPAWPLRLESKLLSRRFNLAFAQFSCEYSKTERAQAFRKQAQALAKIAPDPCAPQPIVEIASTNATVPRRSKHASLKAATFDGLTAYALALLHGTQERRNAARLPLRRALELAATQSNPKESRAQVYALLAKLESSLSRFNATRAQLARAKDLVGEHAAFYRTLAEASERVWKWSDAMQAWKTIAEHSPYDRRAWFGYAMTLANEGHPEEARQIAEQALLHFPHDTGLLRIRWLALESIRHDPRDKVAQDEWLRHDISSLRARLRQQCRSESPLCARDARSIPRIELLPPISQSEKVEINSPRDGQKAPSQKRL